MPQSLQLVLQAVLERPNLHLMGSECVGATLNIRRSILARRFYYYAIDDILYNTLLPGMAKVMATTLQ